MDFITLKDSFSVGINSIDEQHKKLVSYVNLMHQKLFEGLDKDFLLDLMKELKDYTVYHFDYEEDLMKKHQYKDYDAHIEEHQKLKEKLEFFNKELDPENTTILLDFAEFLKNWLLKHIMGTDKKYTAFFQEKGVQ